MIILKGLYYLKVFSEFDCLPQQSNVTKLSEGLDRMLSNKEECEFSIVCISIKASINIWKGSKHLTLVNQSHQIQDHGQYFQEKFKFWMKQRI